MLTRLLGKGMLFTVSGVANWYSCCGTQYDFSEKLKLQLPYDPEIPLLGIYPEETKALIERLHAHYSIVYSSQDMKAA